ncbi:MAG: hypothetical protein JXQ90_17960 [Cyclobacteriaceae bacterium]
MNRKQLTLLTLITLFGGAAAYGQSNDNKLAFNGKAKPELVDKKGPTIIRQAGDHSEEHDVLSFSVLRGTNNREVYDQIIEKIGKALDKAGVPHKFFQEYTDSPGTSFDYFIENNSNGPFNVNELVAMLPEAIRDYKAQYPAKFAVLQPQEGEKMTAGL